MCVCVYIYIYTHTHTHTYILPLSYSKHISFFHLTMYTVVRV